MRVLMAEDEPISRRLLQATLAKWEYEVVVACDGTEALEVLQAADAPKLAILDWMMPGVDGADLCRKVRQWDGKEYTYIILLTAKGSKESIIQGLDAGADDYIVKPFDSGELRVRLRAARRILELESKLLEAHEKLRLQATHDGLTGLKNRSAILEALQREISRCRRETGEVGVIVVDIDKFKCINDTFGHRAGDAALREVARRMEESLRPYDFVGRYGGDEFLVVLPGCGPEDATKMGERLRDRVGGTPVDSAGTEVPVTVSVGVASVSGEDIGDADSVVHCADQAMFKAKEAGRNRLATA